MSRQRRSTHISDSIFGSRHLAGVARTSLGALVLLAIGCADAPEGAPVPDSAVHEGTLVKVLGNEALDAPEYYLARNDDAWVRLSLDHEPAIAPNSPVRVFGVLDERIRHIAVEDIQPAPESAEFRLSSNAPAGSMALFLVKDPAWSGPTPDPYTIDAVHQELIGGPQSAHAFFQEASYGQYGLTADIFGWYTMPVGDCDRDRLRREIEALGAQLDDYDTDAYRHAGFVIIGPSGPCYGGGWGTYGAPNGTGYSWYGPNDASIYAHEVGHNLGMEHASGIVCRDHDGNFTSNTGQCQWIEYHDYHDTMGYDWEFRHFSSYRKSQLGWIDASHVQEVQTSGQYVIVPQERAYPGIQSLLIPTSAGWEWYHLELRESYGFDAGLDQMVLLRRVTRNITTDTYLIDATPQSDPGSTWDNQRNAGLQVGIPFVDHNTGITIELVSVSSTEAVVEVTLGGPTCLDFIHNGDETDVDCGGPCMTQCWDGQTCENHWDCIDYACEDGVCVDADDGGLTASYFSDTAFSSLMYRATVPTVDFDVSIGTPQGHWQTDNVSTRYSGQLLPRFSETYTITTISDDSARLWLDGQLVIDSAIGQASATVPLIADRPYDIVLEWVEYGGDARAQLRWSSPSQPDEVIPRNRLRPDVPITCNIQWASVGYGGFGIHNAFVVNDGPTTIEGWSVDIDFGSATPVVGWIWGASATVNGNVVTVSGPDVLDPGEQHVFGLGGNYSGATPVLRCD